MADVNDLLEAAIKETQNIEVGEEFKVKDLFKGYEWNRIPRADRLLLGTLFLNWANSTGGRIEPTKKTTAGQQLYTAKGE